VNSRRHAKRPDALCISIHKSDVLFSFLSSMEGTHADCQRRFGTVLDLDRVSLRAEVVGAHILTEYTEIHIPVYLQKRRTLTALSRNSRAASQSTFKGPTDVFPVYFRKVVVAREFA